MLRNKVGILKKEIEMVSKEIIKPSSIDQKSPFKISLMDQLIPSTYSPFTFFYQSKITASSATHRLKTSLSDTLSRFYPLSGRLRDNSFVDDFDQGVPFAESRVRCNMSHYLRHPHTEWLNDFVPYRPFFPEPNPSTMPQLAVQANIFDCGGVALGLSLSHKFMDSLSINSFLKSWAMAARGEGSKGGNALEGVSGRLRPVEALPPGLEERMANLWFCQGDLKLRRFVFSAEAIAAIREKGRSEDVTNPTRNEALSSFIWKRVMSATAAVSGCSDKPLMLSQSVDIRKRIKSHIPDVAIGNTVFTARAATLCSGDESKTGLPALVKQVRRSIEAVDNDYVEYVEQKIFDLWGRKPEFGPSEILNCTSFLRSGLDEIDFGWGKPIWVGVFGEISSKFMNWVLLKNINATEKGIEAWVTLRQDVMDVLEKDPKFLSYACLNPPIVSSVP